MDEDIEPYLVYRIEGDQMLCAVWTLKEGPKALALFLSGDSATAYRERANLREEWNVFRPAKNDLLEILKACCQAGIRYAVLDPDLLTAKRIFDIQEILMTFGQ